MKNSHILFILIAIMAFTNPPPANFSGKEFRKNYARVKEYLYVGKYEVTNMDYRSFLSGVLEDQQMEIYRVSLPDTTCWRSETNYNEPYVAYYFRDLHFNEYPVVGISYDGQRKQSSKVRSSFRIKSGNLSSLYKTNELINLDLV